MTAGGVGRSCERQIADAGPLFQPQGAASGLSEIGWGNSSSDFRQVVRRQRHNSKVGKKDCAVAVINPAGSFDPYDPAMREDTPLKYARLARGGCPIRHVTNRFDFHLISDPAYIQKVMLRDTSLWTVEHGPTAVEQPEEIKTPMTRDDESHLWIRKIIQRGFSPGELARIRPLIERLSDELIDAMLASPDREGDLSPRASIRQPPRPFSAHFVGPGGWRAAPPPPGAG